MEYLKKKMLNLNTGQELWARTVSALINILLEYASIILIWAKVPHVQEYFSKN